MRRVPAWVVVVTLLTAGCGGAIAGRLLGTRVLWPSHPSAAGTTATATTHARKQPDVIPPPIKEAEKEGELQNRADVHSHTNTSGNPSSSALAASPKGPAGTKAGTRRSPEREPVTANTQGQPSGDEASPAFSPSATDDPYHDSMLPGGSKWTITTNTPVPASTSDVIVSDRSVSRAMSAKTASANGTLISTAPGDPRCLTITTDFQQDCATANRWLTGIGTQFGSSMQRHYRWLSAERVDDWLKNGCNPSPCTCDPAPCPLDGTGTVIGRIQPTDYFGAQGYDSPLGTCHSSTPAALHYAAACGEKDEAHGCSAARANSTQLALGGVLEGDGKVHGLVRWAGDGLFYEGTITDVACVNGCSAEFDHPCSLPSPLAILFTYRGAMQTNGKSAVVYSWWYGEDPRAPGPWAAGWMAEELP